MKNFRNISAIFGLVILLVGTSFAGTTTNETSKKSEVGILANATFDRVVVSFENDENDPYWVAIEDAEGNTLHSETILKPGVFNKRFDLAELEDGEYNVKVGRGDQVASVERIYRK